MEEGMLHLPMPHLVVEVIPMLHPVVEVTADIIDALMWILGTCFCQQLHCRSGVTPGCSLWSTQLVAPSSIISTASRFRFVGPLFMNRQKSMSLQALMKRMCKIMLLIAKHPRESIESGHCWCWHRLQSEHMTADAFMPQTWCQWCQALRMLVRMKAW